jgi:hypothetical protein
MYRNTVLAVVGVGLANLGFEIIHTSVLIFHDRS